MTGRHGGEAGAVSLTAWKRRARTALFLGDGAPGFEAVIRERLGNKAHFVQPPAQRAARGKRMCSWRQERLEAGEAPLDYITLLPLYLRAPQAERERAAREGAKHG